MANHVCAEIQYYKSDGSMVHSNLCFHKEEGIPRELLHAALDEWINKSRGSGIFYVGDTEELKQ